MGRLLAPVCGVNQVHVYQVPIVSGRILVVSRRIGNDHSLP